MTREEFIHHAVDFIESDEENMQHCSACFDYIEEHLMEVEHKSAEDAKLILQAIQEMFYERHPEIRIAEEQAMEKAFSTICLN